jgi:hypothetical protein
MALPTGLAAQFGMITETTEGTPLTVTHFLEFNNESLKLKKGIVQGKGLRAGGLYERSSRRYVGSWAAAGTLNADASYNGWGLMFQAMMGSYGTFSSSVQQLSSAAYLQTHTPGPQFGNTFTAQVGKPGTNGTVYPFTYPGCKVTDWELSTEVNKMATFAIGIDAWQELTLDNPTGTSAGPALATATYTPSEQFFHFREATLFTGGTLANAGSAPVITSLTTPTAAARITKCSIKQTNSLDTGRFFIAGTGGTGGSSIAGVKSEQLENEYRTISGTMTAEFFTPATYYDVFAGDTNLSLELVFTGPVAIASTYFPTLSILIPVIKFDEESPAVPGPGLVMEDLTFAGLDGETYNQIQIQSMTSDAAF